jgi:hypothetical protein
MPNIFRKIRKQLLSVNAPAVSGRAGKFSKTSSPAGRYLLYAIGEILLVVVGILIALQINIWNEDRVNLIKANKYIATIITDIIQDSTTMNELIAMEKKRAKDFDRYFEFIEQGDVTIEQLKDSISNFRVLTRNIKFTTTTYDQLVASGNFELLPEDQRLKIINYYRACEEIKGNIESFDQSKRLEFAESRKYLDPPGDKYDLFKALNYRPDREFVLQGLRHDNNIIRLDYFKSQNIQAFGKFYLEIAKRTINSLEPR